MTRVRLAALVLALVLTPALASAQTRQGDRTLVESTNTTIATATAVRCVNLAGNAFESCAGAGGSGGTSMADEAAFTFGIDSLTPIGGVFDNTPSLLTEGMVGVGRVSANRHTLIHIGDGSGNERWADVSASGALEVTCDNCGGSTFADNSAFTFDVTNVMPIGYVFDDTAPNAVTENRAATPRMSANRVPYATIRDAAGNERGALVTANNELLVELGAGAASIGTLGANSGVDIGDVTINNASGGSAVNIQDGGNTITVDGTVTAAISGVVQTVTALQSAATANGNGSAATTTSNAMLSIQVDCNACAGGTTVSFEASFDSGTNYVPFRMRRVGTTLFAASTTTAGVTAWEAPIFATTRIRTPISAYSAGTVTTGAKIGGTGSGPNAAESILRDAAGNDRGANVTAANALVVDGSAVTQPVSGTVTITDGAGAVNVIVDSSALPSGAATSAIQTDGTQKAQIVDSGGTVVNATGTSLDVNCTGGCGGAAAFEDNDAFTFDTTGVAITGAVVDDTGTNAVAENSAGAPRMSPNRNLHSTLRDAAGNERGANVTAGNALVVDGSAVTQPISGSVTASDPTFTDATGTAVPANAAFVGGTDGTNTRGLKTDASGELQVDVLNTVFGAVGLVGDGVAVSGAPIRIAGKDGSGNTQDIITDTSGELQIDVLTLPNEGQQTAANSISVAPDTDNDAIGATGAAPPGEVVDIGGRTSGADTTGLMTGLTICTDHAAIDIVTATTTLIVTGVSNRHVRICAINLVSAGANNVALIAGTGATCGTSTAGINGGTTAAEGWNFAANGGISQGGGIGEIMSTKVTGGATGDSVCIITSAAVQLSGTISYAIY